MRNVLSLPIVKRSIQFFLFFLLSFSGSNVFAQTATLRGFVTDQSDGQPMELVNVALQNVDGDMQGSVSNRDGFYQIIRLDPGRYILFASFIGYQVFNDTLDITPGDVRTLNINLTPETEELDEVLVETERTEGVARVIAGQQIIRPAEIERIPTLDVTGDLANYLTTLPSVVTTGDRGGQLFVRGGEPTQNLVLIDGILLYQPFHILGFYSAFPSEILSRTDFYAGGFGSKYGGRLSSVLDIAARSGNDRSFTGTVSVSPFISTAHVEGPFLKEGWSFLASARQSMIEQGAAQYLGRDLPFVFGDFFGKLNGKITDNTRISFTSLKTYDRGTLREEDGGSVFNELRWTNEAVGMRMLMLPRTVAVMLDMHISYSRLRSELGPRDEPIQTSTVDNTYLALEATYFGEGLDVEAGSTLRVTKPGSELSGLFQNLDERRGKVTHWGNYLDFDYDLGSGWHFRPGLRVQFYEARYRPFFEPRVRVVWDRGIHQFNGAAGLYHQEIIGLNDRRDAASIFTAWSYIPKEGSRQGALSIGKPQRAIHSILGYRFSPTTWLDASIEGYFKKYDNLFIGEWTAYPRFTTLLQPASGKTIGFDTRLEVQRGDFYSSLTYGFSSTEYEAHEERVVLWYGEERLRFRPPHDRRHQINVLVGITIHEFDLNVRWRFGSGLPFSRALGFDSFVPITDIVKPSDLPSTRRVIYERPYNSVLPTYHQLDVSVDRTFTFEHVVLTVQGSLVNAYNRKNLFYLDVFTHQRVDQLPLVPSLGVKVEFR